MTDLINQSESEHGNVSEAELSSLRKLWLILATLSSIVGVNVLFAIQGGAIQFASAFGFGFAPSTPKAIAAFWGIILLNIFILLASIVALAHAKMTQRAWTSRYPIRIFRLPPTRGVGLAATYVAVLILTVFPVCMLIKSWRAMLQHGALCSEVNTQWLIWQYKEWRVWSIESAPFWEMRPDTVQGTVRLTSDESVQGVTGSPLGTCLAGKVMDYSVPWLTWCLAALTLITLTFATRSFAALWSRSPDRSKRSEDNSTIQDSRS